MDLPQLVLSDSVMLTFEGKTLPKSISIFKTKNLIEPLINPVIICQKCLRYGHSKNICLGKLRCKKCGKNYKLACLSEQAKCIYGSQAHHTVDKKCLENSRQMTINEAMATTGMSFDEAIKTYLKKNTILFNLSANRFLSLCQIGHQSQVNSNTPTRQILDPLIHYKGIW